MTTRIRLVVLGEPVPMPRARVVRGASGKAHAFTPEIAVQAKERIKRAARLVSIPFFHGPVALEVDAYLSTEGVTYWKRGSGDWDNYAKLVADALEGIAFANDAQVVDGRCRKHPAVDGRPRLEVVLEGTPGEPCQPKPTRVRTLNLVPAVYRRRTT